MSRWSWLFLAVLGLLAAAKMERAADNDLFWQLKDGERVVREGRLPVREEFSFTAQGKPMVAIEWGAEAVSYLVLRAAGCGGLVAFNAGLFVLVFALLLALLRRRLPLTESLCLLALAAFALLNFYGARAQNWTFLFSALFLYWAGLWEDGAAWVPWAMAACLLPWANLHGGFMLGLAMLGVLCLSRAWQSRRSSALAPLGLGAALCCVHPNGIHGLVYPLWFMAAPPPGRALITEWKPLDFSGPTAAPYLLIWALLIWLGPAGRKSRFPWMPWALLLAVLAWRGRKLLAEASMAALAALPLRASAVPQRRLRLALCCAAALALGCTAWVALARPWPRPFCDLERGYPKAAAALISERYPGARVLNDYDWGGYLIYKLHPRDLVFIDGRLDPYWELISGDYQTLLGAKPGWRERLDAYGITVALLKPGTPLGAELAKLPDWRTVLDDGGSVLLARYGMTRRAVR